ncbi:M20 family metallopeptidase [Oceanibacterium hippocampi]|uniref:5-nitroanthranilic acid aminohydrolase n=1 Tax=Oceanibacterium hippocampi TaxID=745714 RepID=A0A1Y5TIG8_9PROT|nr:M20/M25/M40 family metallo-hydrolase [Oceanibacterium hippocampi]SLN64833.1 5-nitroanthranilic acid aminohydrolase [Oceanibacterium hippocampi]
MVDSTGSSIPIAERKEALDFLAGMIRHKSYSGTPGEEALARHMVERMRSLGMAAELQPVEGGRFNAIGRLKGEGGGASLLFNGHLDTNPATDDWTVDPWGGLQDDDFIYGIGVSNMKAGDAAAFMAVKTLLDSGVRLKGDIVLEYVVGELQGGIGTVAAIEQGVRADYFINMEPTDLNGLTLHAGAFNFAIELRGITRHISKREEAVDAILAACDLAPRIAAITFSGAANDEHRTVNRANVGVLRGSLTPDFHDWRPPQVADFARLVGTARYAPSQNEDGVLADLRSLLDDLQRRFPGLRAEVRKEFGSHRISMLPFEVAKDARIVRTVDAAHRAVRGSALPTGPIRPYCYYGTDAAHLLHRAGMEGIVCGPGGKYNTMPDERVDIPDYLDMIEIYTRSILDICERA